MKAKNIVWKALLAVILLAVVLPAACAYASDGALPMTAEQTPDVAAIYAAALPTNENGELSAAVRYVFEDGTYKQYLIKNDQCELENQGQAGPFEKTGAGFVQIYPPQEKTLPSPTPAPAAPVYDSEEYIDEGADTGIRITGYTKYSGGPVEYFLSAGDRIAVITPSALAGEAQTESVMEGLRSWGFEPVMGRHVFPEQRTLEECMEDLRWALEDPDIKAIFCVRGGYGATEVLDVLEDDLIASACKPIIGYSDITAYHGAWTRAGLPSIHACMSAAFGEFPAACAEAEQRIMTGEIPSYECEADPCCRAGTAEGTLIGGNLATFTASVDTAYDSTKLTQPYILFLEEVGENMQHIHRYLTILKHKGILDRAAGIIFGEWTELPANGLGNYGEARGGLFRSVADMISRQFLNGVDVPVAFGFPAGHGDTNYPLLMGATAKLTVGGESYTLSWPEAAGA